MAQLARIVSVLILGAAGVVNNGLIQLAGPTALLSGGPLTNNAEVTGAGRINCALQNALAGQSTVARKPAKSALTERIG